MSKIEDTNTQESKNQFTSNILIRAARIIDVYCNSVKPL